jgi:hypothetical protein
VLTCPRARSRQFHDVVRRALEADGWRITHDPLSLEYGDAAFEIDLGAERFIGAERVGNASPWKSKRF